MKLVIQKGGGMAVGGWGWGYADPLMNRKVLEVGKEGDLSCGRGGWHGKVIVY